VELRGFEPLTPCMPFNLGVFVYLGEPPKGPVFIGVCHSSLRIVLHGFRTVQLTVTRYTGGFSVFCFSRSYGVCPSRPPWGRLKW